MTTPEIVLAVIFVVFLSVCFIYVTRFKAKQRAMGIDPAEGSTESGIAAAQPDDDTGAPKA